MILRRDSLEKWVLLHEVQLQGQKVPMTQMSLLQEQIETLKKSNGNKTKAAQLLGITRRMLYTRLTKYKIEK